jgi:hypothetical protein
MSFLNYDGPINSTDPDPFDIVSAKFQHAYGFRLDGIYCQVTGKRVGITDISEMRELIDSLPGDPDAVADDIAVRIFASMRPSLFWNKMRESTLEEMRVSRPTELLAYLLNRLFAPERGGNLLAIHHDRIRLWQRLEEWGVNDSTNTILYYMLEVDAKLSLSSLSAPFTVEDFLTRFESMPLLLERIQAWYVIQLDSYAKLIKRNELNTRWWRSGNALAKGAFFAAWQEVKPPTQKEIKLASKKADHDFFGGLLMGILGESPTKAEEEAVKPQPIRLPVTKMPMMFGVKKVEG